MTTRRAIQKHQDRPELGMTDELSINFRILVEKIGAAWTPWLLA